MNFADLQTFVTVLRERSFSRAAERLHRSQPAVSLAVRRLEQDCGARLLDRSSKEPALTDAGRVVFERAERILKQQDDIALALTELRDRRRGKVTIGANESTALFLLPLVENFRQRFPKIKVEVRRSLSRQIPGELLAGNLDFGVISYEPADRELQSRPLHEDWLSLILYPRHPLAHRKQIALRELGTQSFIAHNVESPYRALIEQAFQQRKIPLHIDLEMPTIECIKKLVSDGLGIAFAPHSSVLDELAGGSLVSVAIRELRVKRLLRLVQRRRVQHSFAAQAFLECTEETTLGAGARVSGLAQPGHRASQAGS